MGANKKISQHDVSAVDGLLDLVTPDVAGSEALNIEPNNEAFGSEVFVQPLGEILAIFAGVGDKEAQWSRR